ncbi:MAG: hypothetical protein N4A49_07685 [Marinifilaceae bacterium]|jgi:3-methyladenine DNA glycosylase AlkC|nr:hypothetical protein [Marinifilaceae bacterium]
MSSLFKDLYNKRFIDFLVKALNSFHPNFDSESFTNAIFDTEWNNKELKQRMRHITLCLHKYLSCEYKQAIQILIKLIKYCNENNIKEHSLEFMFIPDFVEYYGLEEVELSIETMEEITQFTSCEFAVRPFIIKYPERMYDQMHVWATHSKEQVRRLASEGFRPRLPWAMALPALKEDPNPLLKVLERLKSDPSETVRRSVANNLNDISKDNSGIVIDLAKKWIGESKEVDWVVKHACRTLLKQGNKEVMQIFGFGDISEIKFCEFKINTPKLSIGESLGFQFKLQNQSKSKQKIRLEYAIYFKKANGSLSKKVFKISEKLYLPDSETTIIRKQSFKIITTRKYYVGEHKIAMILNGNEMTALPFELV